ncbi:MAG: triose-phosphate isomerase [Planctomycetota bacterium]
MRTRFIAGNWKMNLDGCTARVFAEGLANACRSIEGGCDVGVFPSFTLLKEVAKTAAGTPLIVGAQDCHQEPAGAYTGEVSAAMAREAGASHVILGHSERRRDFGEDESLLNRKLHAALGAELRPILCVGERLEERDQGRTLQVVRRQVEGALEGFSADQLSTLTIAYEPVWAIGTGRTATPEQAVAVHRAIRDWTAERFGPEFAGRLRIQYGGSVDAKNAARLLSEEEIDGALVGGASLNLESFLAIVKAARGS